MCCHRKTQSTLVTPGERENKMIYNVLYMQNTVGRGQNDKLDEGYSSYCVHTGVALSEGLWPAVSDHNTQCDDIHNMHCLYTQHSYPLMLRPIQYTIEILITSSHLYRAIIHYDYVHCTCTVSTVYNTCICTRKYMYLDVN